MTYFLEEAAIHDLVFREYQLPSPKGENENIVILHLSGLLEAGTAAGAWSVDDHRFTAIFLFHGLHGVVHDALAKRIVSPGTCSLRSCNRPASERSDCHPGLERRKTG